MKAKILVVYDEPNVTYTLKATLEETGFFTFIHSMNQILCCQILDLNMYDLAILDIRMPQMNGFELFHEIRK